MSSLAPIGTPFIELLRVESTNNYAMGLVHEAMARHGMAVFAHEQTRGKGQRSRDWTSQPGKNIALSIIVEPENLDPSRLFLLSMAMANGAFEFFSRHAGEDVSIKWPNDIYWRDRKAAGILIENVWQGNEWKYAVAGIGFNINQTDFGDLANKAVSLLQITGKRSEPLVLAKELCKDLEKQFRELMLRPSAVRDTYRSRLYKLNETVKLKKDNRIFEAIIRDVNPNGQLVVQHGVEESFDVGEVEWLF